MKKRNLLFLILSIIFFFFGFFVSKNYYSKESPLRLPLREQTRYKFINPILLCDVSDNLNQGQFSGLYDKLNNFVTKEKDNGNTISIYFRALTLGKWIGINTEERYSPASLLKVPIMIAYLKLADKDPSILNKQIYYDGSFDENKGEYYKPKNPLDKQGYYSVDFLIKKMIEESDNNAFRLLIKNADEKILTNIFSDLSIDVPSGDSGQTDFMFVKEYSYFFRVLYGSTFLSRENSEKALGYLSESNFDGGLRTGVPSNIIVSQKFGERSYFDTNGNLKERELHDCGIVYEERNPYLLCVMTKGKNFDNLVDDIRLVSKITHDFVLSQK